MSDDPAAPESAVAARIALLLEKERRASEELKARKQRRVIAVSLAIVLPLLAWTLYSLLRYLL